MDQRTMNNNFEKPGMNIYEVLYLIISIIYLLCLVFDQGTYSHFLKPLLMLPLITWVLTSGIKTGRNLLLAALIFSCSGDTLLIFANENASFFIAGLCSFLVAHIFYILLFSKKTNNIASSGAVFNPVILLTVIYCLGFLYFLWPRLHEMKIPVGLYSVIISTMLLYAIKTAKSLSDKNGLWLVLGALAFVVSDSLLAVNKFYQPFEGAGLFIMCTYLFAQFAITRSMLNHEY